MRFQSLRLTLHAVGFAPDGSAHYTLDLSTGYSCAGGWDTGAPGDLTEPDNDPDCRGCSVRYFDTWPPAECNGGGSWLVLGGSAEALTVTIYDGLPWACHNSASGTLLPIHPPS